LNEELIRQVLEIEKQAQTIRDGAMHEAERLPLQAEEDTGELVEQARADAQKEAATLIAAAQAQDECARILAQADANAEHLEAFAMSHFDRAVSYVLDRVLGRE
jgi:vacuolar-type H+-ATPase subunit H